MGVVQTLPSTPRLHLRNDIDEVIAGSLQLLRRWVDREVAQLKRLQGLFVLAARFPEDGPKINPQLLRSPLDIASQEAAHVSMGTHSNQVNGAVLLLDRLYRFLAQEGLHLRVVFPVHEAQSLHEQTSVYGVQWCLHGPPPGP